MHARQASSDVAANRHDPATGAQLPRADFERANADVERPQPGGLRAPSFERLPLEGAALLTAGVPTREWNTASAGRAADTQLPQATLHAAIDEPGFGAAIGQQVALWVRDGAQEARLQLHPAELGPVTVQIALDGQAAHVDFTAAVAATRESIERSLPALAAALRESGFTLAGGSVSSDARQAASDGGRQRSGAGAGGRSQPDGTVEAATAPAPRRWTRSLVDVYA
jgi:hypothetical protein